MIDNYENITVFNYAIFYLLVSNFQFEKVIPTKIQIFSVPLWGTRKTLEWTRAFSKVRVNSIEVTEYLVGFWTQK